MGRKPRSVNLELIQQTRARRLTYEKRRAGLEKKVSELSTLCDVKIGLAIYGPKDDNGQIPKEPTIWPPDPLEFRPIMEAFMRMPKDEKKNFRMSKFFEGRIKDVQGKLAKLSEAKAKAEAEADPYPTWGHDYKAVSPAELLRFKSVLDSRTQQIDARIEFLKTTRHQTYADSLFDDDVLEALAMSFKEDNNNNAYRVQNLYGGSGGGSGSGGLEVELYQPQPQHNSISGYNTLSSIADDASFDGSVNMSSNYLINPSLITDTAADEYAITIRDSVNTSCYYFNPLITTASANDHAISFQNPVNDVEMMRRMMNDDVFLNNVMMSAPPTAAASNYNCNYNNYGYSYAPSPPVGLHVNPNPNAAAAAAQLGFDNNVEPQPLCRWVPPMQTIPPPPAYPSLYDAAGLPPHALAAAAAQMGLQQW